MVAFGHGDPEIEVAPNGMVEVGVRRGDPLIDIFDSLTNALAAGLYSPDLGMSFGEWFKLKERDGLGALPWPSVELTVDGQTELFALQRLADHWVALHTLTDLWLYVHSRGTALNEIALSRVVDRQLYIDGSALRGTDLRSRYSHG
jgi:hypothetical protein